MKKIILGLALSVCFGAFAQNKPSCCNSSFESCDKSLKQTVPDVVSKEMVEINCPGHGRVVFPASMATAGHHMPCCESAERNNFVKINCPGHGDVMVYKTLYDAGHHMPCCEKAKPKK